MRFSRRMLLVVLLSLAVHSLPVTSADEPAGKPGSTAKGAADKTLTLHARRRVETSPKSGRHHSITESVEWKPSETAIVICDMWNAHWCKGASSRVAEMAPRMNEVLTAARKAGVLIIHCPSECMAAYDGTPARRLAQQAPKVATEQPLERWRVLDAKREGALPIDDSDGGCDCQPGCAHGAPWKRQIDTLKIADNDAISDDAQVYYLMRQKGIKNVIVMGVHTNICVLGRPFSIRQMVTQGQNVVLMRDLTDTMYNSRMKPYVSHFTGTDLIVEHIEANWCPTITSGDFVNKPEFRFADDKRKHLAIVMAEDEYETERTLPVFARGQLGRDYRVSLVFGDDKDKNKLPGAEAIRDADVVLVSVRRRAFPREQLALFKEHVAAGKGVVGIRTASHAFASRDGKTPEGGALWPEFDHDVLGGNYTGHHGKGENDAACLVRVLPEGASHPILRGVSAEEFGSASWLYKVSPLAKTATPLMVGRLPGQKSTEPVAWTNTAGKSRVFYTSLGHPDDFKLPAFTKLLKNGIDWAAGLEVKP